MNHTSISVRIKCPYSWCVKFTTNLSLYENKSTVKIKCVLFNNLSFASGIFFLILLNMYMYMYHLGIMSMNKRILHISSILSIQENLITQ